MDKKKILIIIAAVLIVILGAAAVFAAPVYDAYFSEKSVKNITFMGENAGSMEKAQITDLVTVATEKERTVTISVNNEKITIDTSSAGVNIDIDKTVEKIMNAGKNNLFETMELRRGGKITPVFSADKKMLKDVVETQLSEKGINLASYVVDIKEKTADFTILTENNPINYDKIAEEIVEICEKNEENAEIKAEFSDFVWPTADELREDFDIEMKNASKITENGEVKYQSHIVGRKIDFEALKNALNEKKTEFSIPYTKETPKVFTEDLGDEGFPDLLGKYTTYYSEAQWGRAINVKLAASKINGYIMNSGDTFSFNGVVGRRTYANGFKDAAVYSANGVENGVGGGICQVSSTLYAATLYSDLKIVSRRNHSYVVNYMPAGLDATVSYGTIDFLFKNNKKNPIKIKATASGGVLTVRIYGTKENDNTVVLDTKTISYTQRGEKRVFDSSLPLGTQKVDHSGYDGTRVQTYKYVKAPNGTTISTENLGVSTYIPLNKIIKYNDGINPDEQKSEESIEETPKIPENTEPKEEISSEAIPPEKTNGENEEELFVPDENDIPASADEENASEKDAEGQAGEVMEDIPQNSSVDEADENGQKNFSNETQDIIDDIE